MAPLVIGAIIHHAHLSLIMKITSNRGMLLLAIYLVLIGVTGIFGIRLGELSIVVPILALVSGILILLGK